MRAKKRPADPNLAAFHTAMDRRDFIQAGAAWRAHQREQIERAMALAQAQSLLPRPENPALRAGKPRGALDPLDRVLIEILLADPWLPAEGVKRRLKERAAARDRVVAEVRLGAIARSPFPASRRPRRTRQADMVIWVHSKTGKRKRTAWSSIQGRRLPRLRKLVRPAESAK